MRPESKRERMALVSTGTLQFELYKESSVAMTKAVQGRVLLSVVLN